MSAVEQVGSKQAQLHDGDVLDCGVWRSAAAGYIGSQSGFKFYSSDSKESHVFLFQLLQCQLGKSYLHLLPSLLLVLLFPTCHGDLAIHF